MKYLMCSLREVILKIERDLSNRIQNTSISGVKFSFTTPYREVQLDLTPEIEVCHMLFERRHTNIRKRSDKRHIKYFNFRS